MKYSLSLGKLFGIKVQIHWTFIFLVAYVLINSIRAGANTEQAMYALVFVLSVFACVTLHEFGHALAARQFGVQTKDITLLPIGGIARLDHIPERPFEEFAVAIAGPLVNIIIALMLMPLIIFPVEVTADYLAVIGPDNFLFALVFVNIWLALFNLIPAFPMDGGRILRSLLAIKLERHKATAIAAGIGQFLAFGFVVLGLYLNPILILIGIFIYFGAQREVEFTKVKSLLKGYTVSDVLMCNFQTLSLHDTVQTAVKLLLEGQEKSFVVIENSEVIGIVDRDALIKAMHKNQGDVLVSEIMIKDFPRLKSDTQLEEGFQLIQKYNHVIPVYENKQLIGLTESDNIAEFILIKNVA